MGSDDAEEAAQTVQRLNHGREQSGITAIAGKKLADRELEPADKLLGLLAFLIGHVRSPSARSKSLHAGKYTTSAKTYQILPARAVGAPSVRQAPCDRRRRCGPLGRLRAAGVKKRY